MTLPDQHGKTNCGHCGRWIARDRRKHLGKGMMRHKCLHGRWCDRGNKYLAGNNTPGCSKCSTARQSVLLDTFGVPFSDLVTLCEKAGYEVRVMPRHTHPTTLCILDIDAENGRLGIWDNGGEWLAAVATLKGA